MGQALLKFLGFENHELKPLQLTDEEEVVRKKVEAVALNFRGRKIDSMNQICDGLFLGSYAAAKDAELLSRCNITHVLNCAESDCPHGVREYITYKAFDAQDNPTYDILQHSDAAEAFIDSARADGGACLVHCLAGMNRSAALVAAYYMRRHRTPVLDTVKHIHQCRGILLTNDTFQRSLVRFASKQNLLKPS